jgi:vacuolar-type H+-ATPase subunit E/Vma4
VSSEDAIKKLETSNQGLKVILEHLNEQLTDIRLDPRLVDNLENLFYAYLKTWIKSKSKVIDILKKDTK